MGLAPKAGPGAWRQSVAISQAINLKARRKSHFWLRLSRGCSSTSFSVYRCRLTSRPPILEYCAYSASSPVVPFSQCQTNRKALTDLLPLTKRRIRIGYLTKRNWPGCSMSGPPRSRKFAWLGLHFSKVWLRKFNSKKSLSRSSIGNNPVIATPRAPCRRRPASIGKVTPKSPRPPNQNACAGILVRSVCPVSA
jgi:hypothetical protein